MYCFRNNTTHNRLREVKALTTGQWFDVEVNITKLSMTSTLMLVASVEEVALRIVSL
jgi:hypothetical protein